MKKIVKHLLHDARHACHMRADIADPDLIQDLVNAQGSLKEAWKGGNFAEVERAAEALSDRTMEVYPPMPLPHVREYVEIIAVALAVAMAFRTYFIQPFKIPTGSMQPTLYGITVENSADGDDRGFLPLRLLRMVLYGETHSVVKAKVSGRVSGPFPTEDGMSFFIGGRSHPFHQGMKLRVAHGDYVNKGDILAGGNLIIGDHIFVDKVRYNFSRPKRGDIIVFSTQGIPYDRIRENTFYIKRLAGLPGDVISVDPPYLLESGERILEPYPFRRMVEEKNKGYSGYFLAQSNPSVKAFLKSPWDTLELGHDEYLPLGDNSAHSLDGRYFGPIQAKRLVGPAFAVYWPISPRWGSVQ
ncbi:MAG: signal peptidase I [Verrucomicrobia bacterium]|nr:signal peptidase I [Verrucomicrobiota bacterium]